MRRASPSAAPAGGDQHAHADAGKRTGVEQADCPGTAFGRHEIADQRVGEWHAARFPTPTPTRAAIDPGTAYSFPSGKCWLGLAYGLAGRHDEAAREIAKTGNWNECHVFAADLAEHRGDRAGADALYAKAIRISPSMPFSYQHWGIAYKRRGDLVRAEAMFRKAHETGPHWADPLATLGDLAARRGDWRAAADLYGQATAYAPGWKRLLDARASADAQVAAMPWWKRWFG